MEEQEDMVGRLGPGGTQETTGSSGLDLQGGGVKGVACEVLPLGVSRS